MSAFKKTLFIFLMILTGCEKDDINMELTVLIGDSRFYYMNDLELDFVPEFVNLSEIGQTSEEISNFYPEIKRLCENRNCTIIIQVGVNDILKNTSISNIEDSITKFSNQINSINAELFITSTIPVSRSYKTLTNNLIEELNISIQRRCKLNSCRYTDILDNLQDNDGYLKEYLTTDGIHLTRFGRRLFIHNMKENGLFN